MPSRTVFNTCRSCLRSAQAARPRFAPSTRSFSVTSSRPFDEDTEAAGRPRWQYTPPRMNMPIRLRTRRQGEYKVNENPRKLDQALSSFFGDARNPIPLSDEVKWLTVTHKSFDHGKRGFNDRLAFLGMDDHLSKAMKGAFIADLSLIIGKRIVDLQTSLALLDAPLMKRQHNPQMFHHPDLSSLDNLTEHNKTGVVDRMRLSGLARQHGLHEVVRWKPKEVCLMASRAHIS